jgi:glycerol-3-phosphate dehydrogenase
VQAKALVNAAGPWILDVLEHTPLTHGQAGVRLVKGSHIVVPKLFEHDRAYIFQNADQRIVFAIPYAGDFTLIGTTDVDFRGAPEQVKITVEEIDYLCASASEYFSKAITPVDVVWSYSGVRPLFDDGESSAQETTRDYVLDLQGGKDEPALLNVFGGKITTYRRLAEEALDKLRKRLPGMTGAWTAGAALPGGDFPTQGFEQLVSGIEQAHPGLDRQMIRRLARAYGTRARDILRGARAPEDLGVHFGAGLYQREVDYLVRNEWARSADDILWRRSKLGLRMTPPEVQRLEQWLAGEEEPQQISAG